MSEPPVCQIKIAAHDGGDAGGGAGAQVAGMDCWHKHHHVKPGGAWKTGTSLLLHLFYSSNEGKHYL